MSRLLGLDKAANSLAHALPDAAKILADKLPEAAAALTKNAPETFTAAAKSLSENLPEALSSAAKVIAESPALANLVNRNKITPFEKNISIFQTVAIGVAATGILVASFSYAYDVYKRHHSDEQNL